LSVALPRATCSRWLSPAHDRVVDPARHFGAAAAAGSRDYEYDKQLEARKVAAGARRTHRLGRIEKVRGRGNRCPAASRTASQQARILVHARPRTGDRRLGSIARDGGDEVLPDRGVCLLTNELGNADPRRGAGVGARGEVAAYDQGTPKRLPPDTFFLREAATGQVLVQPRHR